ncbi:MAG TPA: alpha/beta hydrolase [Gammaproteobacteria bacterium]
MQQVRVNGVRIACQVTGRGAGLLLLHGLGGSHDDWRRQVPVLGRHYRLVVPDLRGFGASERRGPFTIRQHARDAAALLDALGIRRAHVAGLSMGGAVALALALAAPGRVAGLVLANTAPSFELSNWERRHMAFRRFLLAATLGVAGVARTFAKSTFPAPHQARLRRRQLEKASHTSRWVYIASLRSLTRWNMEDRLSRIAAPTLVLGAEHDYTSIAEKRRWAALMPDARVQMLPGSRHRSELDSPRAFNEALLRFLGSIPIP